MDNNFYWKNKYIKYKKKYLLAKRMQGGNPRNIILKDNMIEYEKEYISYLFSIHNNNEFIGYYKISSINSGIILMNTLNGDKRIQIRYDDSQILLHLQDPDIKLIVRLEKELINLQQIFDEINNNRDINLKIKKVMIPNQVLGKLRRDNIIANNPINKAIKLIQTRPKNFYKYLESGKMLESSLKLYQNEEFHLFNDVEFDEIFESVEKMYENLQPGSNDYYVLKRIIPVNSEVIFLGDYHSSLHALVDSLFDLKSKGYFNDYWVLKRNCYLVCTGDMVDRGPYGVEIIYLLHLLFLNNNKESYRFFILNGNHEEKDIYTHYGLKTEIKHQFKTEDSRESFMRLLTKLPVALFLKNDNPDSKWYQFCHGGIDFQQYGENNIITDFLKSDNMGRNLQINMGGEGQIQNGFLWSDFTNNKMDVIIEGDRPIFPPSLVEEILDDNNILSVISGHQDIENFGFVYRPSLTDNHSNICKLEDEFDYTTYYPKRKPTSLCTLKTIKSLKSGDGKSRHIISMDKAMAITTSSATISKANPKACYGILDIATNVSSINFLDTCNTDYLEKGDEPKTCNN